MLGILAVLFATVLTGHVRDAQTNKPIAGATVEVWQGPKVITGAEGTYSLEVPVGSSNISSRHPDYMTFTASMRMTPGQQRTHDFALQQLARVTGVVVDETNHPVAAATITPRDARSLGIPDMASNGAVPVTSGPDGKFEIRVLPGSDFVLHVAKKGWPRAKSAVMNLDAGARRSDVTLTIPAGIAVTGRVLDANGKPLSGASVVAGPGVASGGLETLDTFMEPLDQDPVRTAADGTFAMRLNEGTYNFWFRRDGYLNKKVAAQRIAAASENTVEARLDPAFAISGRVTRGGVGVANVEVRPEGGILSSVQTSADGSFVLGGRPPGFTRLEIIKRSEFIDEKRAFTAPSQGVVIDLKRGGTIRGRVVERGTTTPIRSFRAGVMVGLGNLSDFNSEDGTFTIEHVPAGVTTLAANAYGYEGTHTDITVVDGETVSDVVLELERGVRLTGRVTDATGAPLSGVTVVISPQEMTGGMVGGMLGGRDWKPAPPPRVKNTDITTVTDANGNYTFEGLTRGDENVRFSHPGHLERTRRITLAGYEVKLDVQLP